MTKNDTKDTPIMFWTTREQRDRLLARARQEDRTISSMLRVMIDQALPVDETDNNVLPLLQLAGESKR